MFEIIGFIPTSIIFLLVGLYFIHKYRGITYSTYLTSYNSFNIEIVLNGYSTINYKLFILYQAIYTLIMGTSYSMCFNMVNHIITKDNSIHNIMILLLSAIANSYITNIYLYKIGYLYDNKSNDLNIKHNNIQMMFVNHYHNFNAIVGIFIGSISALLFCIYNSDIAIAILIYLSICLGSLLIRYYVDKKKDNNIFGSLERVYCWTLYYGILIYSLKTFDTKIYFTSLIIISFWGFQLVHNNYNMTLQHINTITKYQSNNINPIPNESMFDLFNFMINNNGFYDIIKRIIFLFELNTQKNKYINNCLESLSIDTLSQYNIDDKNSYAFLSKLYNIKN